MNIALYFGSFNPLHIGHLSICHFLIEQTSIDQLRLVVSPRNPLKGKAYANNARERLEYVRDAVERANFGRRVAVCDIEYHLTPPLYTINTLRKLREREPLNNFILVMGADNLAIIEKWHKWEELIQEFRIWVYPRTGYDTEALCINYGVQILRAPLIEISSTQIREAEESGLDMSQFRV
ncbi:MAG: nicotinate (nicotinamide) nucleotide adenylyltransferase [Bacteroidales bacterium]|jgi:nicotinate-nucleotide adenylyltransferase|nr:nicotinate (nicotinamide) nucleotide adenylyltransferase [Bacteroidales bacterium]MDP3399465.1 nicotinate (nicotinamide) nucleotide adenylyltransferase [Bacteroidales bacterium]